MGGEGSGRKPDLTKSLMPKPQPELKAPIATDMFLPNLSGMANNVNAINNFLKIDASNGPITGVLKTTADQSSADTEYFANVLYGTDSTPPTASTVPIGSVYLQYTA